MAEALRLGSTPLTTRMALVQCELQPFSSAGGPGSSSQRHSELLLSANELVLHESAHPQKEAGIGSVGINPGC